jgi:leucine dehydrogenase
VGGRLAELLKERGADVVICDINEGRVAELCEKYGFESVEDEHHLDVECDVYSPCARGATLNDETIPQLKCRAVAGCANNQLLEFRHADMLRERGLLYAPDYVINAGGIVNVACELLPGGYDENAAIEKIDRIYVALKEVFRISQEEDISTREAAARLAEQRIAAGKAERQAAAE